MPNNISYKKLLNGVINVIQSGEYENFLKSIKKLQYNFSFRNSLLIFAQNPNATIVKGFCDWNKLGRGIKKRPNTIYIYVPIKYKTEKPIDGQKNINGKEQKNYNNSSTIEIIEGIRYKRVAVFDIEDTYLKRREKKIEFLDERLNNNTTKELYQSLVNISPVPVILDDNLGTVKGYFDKTKIAINKYISQDDKTSVLLHELAHCLYDNFDYKVDRDKSEIFVESVAFLVADYFNFDTSECSFKYITNWAENDIQNFLKLSNKIIETTKEYIKLIQNNIYKQEKIIA